MKNKADIQTKTEISQATGLVRPVYEIFTSTSEGNFEQQWQDCFIHLVDYLKSHPWHSAFIIRVFADAGSMAEFQQRASLIKKSFSGISVPAGVVAQSPEKPALVMIEAGFADTRQVQLQYSGAGSERYCRITAGNCDEYWFPGLHGISGYHTISDAAMQAFIRLQQALGQAGLGFNEIVRQWNYVEQIFNFSGINDQLRQNYQQFNEVRGHFYSTYRTIAGFPAATGIGTLYHGVTIDCMAVTGNRKLKVVPVSNPRQVNSFLYAQSVLKGAPPGNQIRNQAPQFERARLMTDGSTSRLFISGTASIIGQQTIGINDIKKQTLVTIDNLEQLTSNMNLKSCCPGLTVFPEKYVYIRVYVKHEKDIPDVKALCLEHFGQIPMSIVQADICRSDLLVEIEGEKIS